METKTDAVHLVVLLIFAVAAMIWWALRVRRKTKDVYGFQMPGWTILKDDQRLYEIEHAFKYGAIANTLNQTGYSISDWHSNFEHKTFLNSATGYIQLSKYAHGVSYTGESRGSLVLTHLDTQGYRYLWCKLQNSYDDYVHVHSGNLVLLEANQSIQKIQNLLKDLESIKGLHTWHVIFFKNELIILIDELWTQSEVDRFLKIGLAISERL